MPPQEPKKDWNVGEILDWSMHYLSDKKFENPRLNAEWLLCHTLECKRIDLYTNYDRPLDRRELEQFKSRLLRRVDHEPLQYIVGSTDFMGLTFEVNKDVLIPRPDTETLVERTLELCRKNSGETVHILDIGTGSGVIAVSLAFYLEKYLIPCSITALDVSEKALEVAAKNEERILGKEKIHFVCGSILDEGAVANIHDTFDLLVSNPPYISDKEYTLLPQEVKDHEPELALRAPGNGLAFYEHIAGTAKAFFRSNLTKKHVIFEVGYDQAEQVKNILTGHNFDVEIFRDYQQVNRVVCGSLSQQH